MTRMKKEKKREKRLGQVNTPHPICPCENECKKDGHHPP